MDGFLKSVGEAIRRRSTSAVIGTYSFFWITMHWQGVYTGIFVDQNTIYQKYGLLKNEYLNTYFFSPQEVGYLNFLWGLLLPLLLTYVFIWVLPKFIFIRAFIEERDYKLEKQKILIDNEIKLEQHRQKLADTSAQAIDAEKRVAKKEKELEKVDPTFSWKKEFELFDRSGLTKVLGPISSAVYTNGGRLRPEWSKESSKWIGVELNNDVLAIAHTNGLIEIENERISLTEKGKYFIGQSYSH